MLWWRQQSLAPVGRRATPPDVEVDPRRRALLGALVGAAVLAPLGGLGAGCAPTTGPAPIPPPPTPPPLAVERLTDLVPSAGLRWLFEARPAALLGSEWLRPLLGRVLHDERLELLARSTGVDLRTVPELLVGSFDAGQDDAILYAARHQVDALHIERLFRERLTRDERRSVEEDGRIVRVSGRIGQIPRVLVTLGREVVAFQFGGSVDAGPARVAALYAEGKLHRSPALREDRTLGPVWNALDGAPARGLLPGPFEGPDARGLRGLLGSAEALALALSPTARRSLALAVLVAGDYSADPARAAAMLAMAFADLGQSDVGHLLGLGEPASPARAAPCPLGLRLDVELGPEALFAGLAAATMDNVRDIMQ